MRDGRKPYDVTRFDLIASVRIVLRQESLAACNLTKSSKCCFFQCSLIFVFLTHFHLGESGKERERDCSFSPQ